MSEDPISACQECGSPVERVFHPVAVHFKGSGFYTTDYGRKRGHAADSGGEGSKESGDTASTKSDTKSDSKSDSKSEAKASESSD